jgi:hypothetical protein
LNRLQQVVEFVSNSTRQRADGFHLLGLAELGFTLSELFFQSFLMQNTFGGFGQVFQVFARLRDKVARPSPQGFDDRGFVRKASHKDHRHGMSGSLHLIKQIETRIKSR